MNYCSNDMETERGRVFLNIWIPADIIAATKNTRLSEAHEVGTSMYTYYNNVMYLHA